MGSSSGIHISRIAVEGFGPLQERSFELGPFNLIYGHNESGKTLLIEFLLRSLFKHASQWPLRSAVGGGKVYLQGLADTETAFSPEREAKLEDLLAPEHQGLPPNLARLLVVRGGELELDEQASGGADRRVVSAIVSSQEMIDHLKEAMQATVRQAKIVGGKIEGDHRGELKQRNELLDQLTGIDRLQEQVEERLSGAQAEQLKQEQARLQADLEAMEQAKRHRAFQLGQQLAEIRLNLGEIPKDKVERLKQELQDHQRLQKDIEQLTAKVEAAQQQSENFAWLEQAVAVWQKFDLDRGAAIKPWGIIAAGPAILAAAVLWLLQLTSSLPSSAIQPAAIATGLLVMIGLAGIAHYLFALRRGANQAALTMERQAVVQEFEERFEDRMSGLAALQARFEQEREAHSRLELLQSDLRERESASQQLQASITGHFQTLLNEIPEEGDWARQVDNLEEQADQLQKKAHELELELERLALPEELWRREPTEVAFDPKKLADLARKAEDIETAIQTAEQDVAGLKGEVARHTGDAVTAPWEDILANFWKHRQEVESDYRSLTSRILAQIALSQVLAEFHDQESEKIQAGLSAPAIRAALEQITGRYRDIRLVGGELVVGSATADYQLGDLSTGAREQVLMALRLGFASRLAAGRPLFLLLDDAFQHSDWERRERLVDSMIDLTNSGWQVTYLTMDDHLRDLILAKGQEAFNDQMTTHMI